MKRRKKDVPLMLLWSRKEQRRFVVAVERFVALVGDLQVMFDPIKRKAAAKAAAEALRAAHESGMGPSSPQGT